MAAASSSALPLPSSSSSALPSDDSFKIRVQDGGHFHVDYILYPGTKLKNAFVNYLTYLCPECTDGLSLEFSFQGRKLSGNDRPQNLGLADGDRIDVVVSQEHTRGRCPVPEGQRLPNIHYPGPEFDDEACTANEGQENAENNGEEAEAEEAPNSPSGPAAADSEQNQASNQADQSTREDQRIELILQDQSDNRMQVHVKPGKPLDTVLQKFAAKTGRDRQACRFFHDDARVHAWTTPAELKMESGDVIELHTEQMGGDGG